MSKLLALFFLPVLAAALFSPAVAYAAGPPRTTTVWTVDDTKGINVIPYVRVDKKALFVDFDHFTSDMDYIYYNLNYVNKNTGVKGGVEGSFLTSPLPKFGNYGGFDYARRELVYGTCSKNVCNYHSPKTVTLTVNTHFSKGTVAQYTKVLTFNDDQF
ncbi:MAG: hypothetical protein UY21_C0009G0025 [Microgenomates group bacterium GW2011_GWA1_48_10]|nr:MAG: hypothetical protein UY21_C0009G0025 [Microgenomates group bacterium GW2011_GWA1_48_10]